MLDSIELLVNTPIDKILSNLEMIFENLIKEIKLYLNFDLIYKNIKLIYTKTSKKLENNFINFGVKKHKENNVLKILIIASQTKFIRIILLREAYKCFVPNLLQENPLVNIIINQKVEIDLQKSEYIERWKELKREKIINYEFMKYEFHKLKGFLIQAHSEDRPSPFQFFYSYYIQNNIQLLEDYKNGFYGDKSFYDLFFEDYERRYHKYSEEILETICIITKIFYEVKSYRSLIDYQEFFKKFQEMRIFQTNMSLRRFTENMHWIRDFSPIAPSYKINWPALRMISTCCFMKFHPRIENAKIRKMITQLPFLISPSSSKNDFGLDISGYFLLPEIYLKDFIELLEKMEEAGYLIDKRLYIISAPSLRINLNLFKTSLTPLINPNKQDYYKDFEFEHEFEYGNEKFGGRLNLLDWLLISRIYGYSITHLGFERKSETLSRLKEDLLNEIESQRKLIKNVKKNLNKIHSTLNFRNRILELIDKYKFHGFFFIRQLLDNYVILFELIQNLLSKNSTLTNYFKFQEFVRRYGISKTIENNILPAVFNKKTIQQIISLYFNSIDAFNEKVEEYRKIRKIFYSFSDLKIFNLDQIKSIINDNSIIQKIYLRKEEKLEHEYEQYKTKEITYKLIYHKLENYLDNEPPIIKPFLLNSLSLPKIKMNIAFILKDTMHVREKIKKLVKFFPRVEINNLFDYKTNEKFIQIQLQCSYFNSKETRLLISILHKKFAHNIQFLKFYYTSISRPAFSLTDYYDLEQEDFYYTQDLFEQFYLYISKLFDVNVSPIKELGRIDLQNYWKKRNISYLISHIEKRISKEHIDFNFKSISKLFEFHNHLKDNLINVEVFKAIKKEYFYNNYITAVKFIPVFQAFGFGQYFLYFYPLDLGSIDFKHFLHNSFQKIKYTALLGNTNSFLINFIWPYNNPNDKILNWFTKSKKIIREYCLFFIKKVYYLFHFEYNLSVSGWNLDFNKFRVHFERILFESKYHIPAPKLKEINVGDLNVTEYFPPDSPEYKALSNLYSWKSLDVKSYLGTRYNIVKDIIELLEKELIFPYIIPKNLDLIKKIYIILPNVKKEYNEKLLEIFSFFNIGFIYEIEGEYYIHGFNEEVKFENGLMIKIHLPDCQLDEFETLFDLIFEYLGIPHYVILNDLVDGKNLLRSIYGNLDFLKSYNPLKNLIWNNKDKIWINHKLFDGKFNKIYPDLLSKE
jgi:hypothetical protein